MRRLHSAAIPEIFHLRRPSILSPLDSDLAVRISTMVANRRERAIVGSVAEISARSEVPLRNQFSTASQILQTLHGHKQKLLTRAPPRSMSPHNQKQRDAQTYRLSQVRLLTELVDSLAKFLRSALEGPSVLSLEYVLQNSPRAFIVDFRAAIHETLRTRNAHRIRKAGFQRVVWTVWVCTLWIYIMPEVDSTNDAVDPTHDRLAGWTRFIKVHYGEPLTSRHTACIEHENREARAVVSDAAIPRGSIEIAGSGLSIVRAAATKSPDCIYADPRWTSSFLAWGSKVADESLMMYPTFEEMDEIEPELLLVLEP